MKAGLDAPGILHHNFISGIIAFVINMFRLGLGMDTYATRRIRIHPRLQAA